MLKIKQMMMVISCLTVSAAGFANSSLDGTKWQTIDDNTGKPRAVVEFTEKNGLLNGTVIALVDKNAAKTCQHCSGSLKNAPVVGLRIVRNLKPVSGDATAYENGTILDPYNGKTYKLKGQLSDDGKELNVRGFIGISLLGRTQTWHRLPAEPVL